MHYYQFHIGDFRSGTVNMSRQARWLYRDMLDAYYDTERPLPADLDAICEMLGVENDVERKIIERHLKFKFVLTEDGYRHEVCDEVIADYHAKADTARENGKKGGRRKVSENNPAGSDQVATGNQDACGSEANHKPLTSNQEPRTSGKTLAPAKPSPSSRGSRLQADWELPTEWAEWALAEFPNVPIIEEAAKFRDHWLSKSGKDATKADWLATWRNWVRNADKWAKGSPQKPKFISTLDHNRAAAEEALRRAEERESQNAGQ